MSIINPEKIEFLRFADNDVLAAVARGEIDLNLLARALLADRGLDSVGRWIGVEAAQSLFLNEGEKA